MSLRKTKRSEQQAAGRNSSCVCLSGRIFAGVSTKNVNASLKWSDTWTSAKAELVGTAEFSTFTLPIVQLSKYLYTVLPTSLSMLLASHQPILSHLPTHLSTLTFSPTCSVYHLFLSTELPILGPRQVQSCQTFWVEIKKLLQFNNSLEVFPAGGQLSNSDQLVHFPMPLAHGQIRLCQISASDVKILDQVSKKKYCCDSFAPAVKFHTGDFFCSGANHM